jgi:poly-gamma-glutamate capsule biosynthesis protein CapA/YwtB (metallophosphatase superfamily)
MTGNSSLTLFLCGDVMTGRGIDQILPHPNHPGIHESFVQDAGDYVELAEQRYGEISRPVPFSYIWGTAIREFNRVMPDIRIINLETTITQSEDWIPKGINYRMHPDNIACLTSAKINCCVLGNNHMLDFDYSGLVETLESLTRVGIKFTGAGPSSVEAETPAILNIKNKGRVLVFSFGMETSGVPKSWAATPDRPGINFLEDLSPASVNRIANLVKRFKENHEDIAIASIHWGGNWGYEITNEEISFAHDLIDEAGINIVHGHSSHHPKGIEVYQDCPILYGCGDFISDYEGIQGYEVFRGDLGLMYFVTMDPSTGKLVQLEMIPTQMKRLHINRVSMQDAHWLRNLLNREGRPFGIRVDVRKDQSLSLQWKSEVRASFAMN